MQIKKDIILRFGILYLGIVALAIWIVGKIFVLQVVEGDKWKDKEQKQNNKDIIIDANRGDVLAADGRKLACSVPSYRIYMDMMANGLSDPVFNANVDSLAIRLSCFFGDNSVSYYCNMLKKGRQQQKRYFMIHPRRISYTDLKEVKTFPIFRLGANKGGFIARKYERRRLPFGVLASRTIGSLYAEKELGGRFGLEMAYDNDLRGISGISTKTRVSGNWVTEEQVEPVDGKDVVTTIDIG
ncbi:MAG: peptidoglycan glycosyltransferase, partial [Marinilabiliaceae bacterium]|nr:peptidoglycan glycosyltransferase [Marinilabiliaceae bacterium]